MQSFSTRTFLYRVRSGASRMALVQVLGRPRAGPAMPPQMLGAASSTHPSRSKNGPQAETPTAEMSALETPALWQLCPIRRMTCWPRASDVPSLTVGSVTRPRMPLRSAMLTATLVPPMSTQAFRPSSDEKASRPSFKSFVKPQSSARRSPPSMKSLCPPGPGLSAGRSTHGIQRRKTGAPSGP